MKKSLLVFISATLFSFGVLSQTVNPDFVDGVVHFKLNDNSLLELDPYQNNIPALNLIFTTYGVDTIYKPFKLPGTALDKIYRLRFSNIALVENLIAEIELLPDVEFAEKCPLYRTTSTPNDFQASQQWSLQKINAEQAWDLTTGSTDVVIAIVDNAVLHSHQDLAANRWVNTTELNGLGGLDDDFNGYTDDIYGYDVADMDGNPEPPSGILNSSPFIHGTHVAGIAAATTNNNMGIASVSYNCKFMSVKCSANSSTGEGISSAQDGVFYAMQAGADVISMSFGNSADVLVSQLILNQAYSDGIVLVAAAGNSNTDTAFFPAAYSNVIAVGATDENDIKASFSNYGSWVDVMAPGKNIYSALPEGGNTFGNRSGTSMAAPLVAGLSGLVLSYAPALSPSQVKDWIQQGCDNINGLNPSYSGQLGAGRINAFHTLSPVGIQEILINNNLHIFPNPMQSGSYLFIKMNGRTGEKAIIDILDIAGKKLFSEQFILQQEEQQLKLSSVNNLVSGTYFMQLVSENRILTERFVIY